MTTILGVAMTYDDEDNTNAKILWKKYQVSCLKGEGGVPWVQIMENELECLGDRRGHDGHSAKKFLKKIILSPSYRG